MQQVEPGRGEVDEVTAAAGAAGGRVQLDVADADGRAGQGPDALDAAQGRVDAGDQLAGAWPSMAAP